MSMYLPPIGGLFGGLFGVMVANQAGVSDQIGIAIAAVGAIFGFTAWIYSPLPSTNGGMFGPPARKQNWGWTSDPAKEYEAPDTEDYMTANLVGINWADEVGGEDDGD